MSSDLQIAFPCPHLLRERVFLEPDRRTIIPGTAIGGTGMLSLLADDREVSGAFGIRSPAELVSGRPEPYRIEPAARSFTVRTASTSQTFSLTPGVRRADAIVAEIGAVLRGFVGVTTENGRLKFREARASGPDSSLFLDGGARAGLGFAGQFSARGRVSHPGYDLYGTGSGYGLRLDAEVRSTPRYTLTYGVPRERCPRCGGSEVENDWRFDESGAARQVSGYNLLYQVVLKALLTRLGSNLYARWYGSGLLGTIGLKAGPSAVPAIRETVSNALETVRNLQTAAARYQALSAEERLYAIDYIYVTPSPIDPTVYRVEVGVRSYSSNPVSVTIVYSTSGAVALPGTNGLTLGNGL